MRLSKLGSALVSVAIAIVAAAPAHAIASGPLASTGAPTRAAVFSVRGAQGAGPARFDRVLVQRFGPTSARTVLVLVPGTTSGAGVFTFVARDLVCRVRGLQVWAVDRREQAFEDTSVIAGGDPDQALAYYLRGQPVGGRIFSPPPVSKVRFMAKWGLGLLLGDLHQVVRKARAGGRRVILGGHSLGASVAEAYASWDFAGRAGYRDLTGLVLIDGGLPVAPTSLTPVQARATLDLIRTEGPRLDILGQQRPYLYGVLSAIAGLYAEKQPQQRSPLDTVLPPPFQPPFPTTNQTWLGLASQVFYPPKADAVAHAGHPATTGVPRPWIDGDITPIARLAQLLTQTPINTVDWYIPRRLVELDIRAAEPLAATPLTRLLGLRLTHRSKVRLALYAFATSPAPAVLRSARRFARASRIHRPTLVADPLMVHFDPLTALPARNTFVRSVTPFLRRVAGHQETG
jgi:pimeloyl-ACP methyl ester carboxylesterase